MLFVNIFCTTGIFYAVQVRHSATGHNKIACGFGIFYADKVLLFDKAHRTRYVNVIVATPKGSRRFEANRVELRGFIEDMGS